MTDYGNTKARCAYTNSSRSVRLDDRNLSASKAKEIPIRRVESENGTSQSLLQIFESELASAKGSSQEPALNNLPFVHHGDNSQRNRFSTDRSANHTLSAQQLPPDLKRNQYPADILSNQGDICAPIHQAVDDIGKVILELQKPASTPEGNRSSRILREALQLGLSAALQSLGACMQNISDTVQHSLVDSSTEDLQKLLTAIRCSVRNPPVHFLSNVGLEKDLKSQHHNQVYFAPGRSTMTGIGQRERITPKDCLSTHPSFSDPSNCLGAHSSVDASANSIDLQTMPSRPSSHERFVGDIAQETAGEIVTPNFLNNPDRNVIWRTQEVHDSPRTIPSVDGLSHKTSKVTNEAPNISYKVPDTSHMDAPLGLSCESVSKHSRFPLLPTMEPLIPYNEPDPSNSHSISDGNRESSNSAAFRDRECPNPRAIDPVTPEEPRVINVLPKSVRITESSGQFFNRMTGRSTEHSKFRDQDQVRGDGIQRNATVAWGGEEDGSSSCGPYTINSNGNIRIPWNSIAQRLQTPLRGWERLQTEGNDTRPGGDGRCISHSRRSGMLADMAYAVDHSDAATAGKVQECVEQLQILGFHHNSPDGLGRLVVYAQAAEGELSGAIDMIDEEQRAYDQRQ